MPHPYPPIGSHSSSHQALKTLAAEMKNAMRVLLPLGLFAEEDCPFFDVRKQGTKCLPHSAQAHAVRGGAGGSAPSVLSLHCWPIQEHTGDKDDARA